MASFELPINWTCVQDCGSKPGNPRRDNMQTSNQETAWRQAALLTNDKTSIQLNFWLIYIIVQKSWTNQHYLCCVECGHVGIHYNVAYICQGLYIYLLIFLVENYNGKPYNLQRMIHTRVVCIVKL